VPTILDIAGLEMPPVYDGVQQYPLNGVSMRYTFDAKPEAPTQKKRQYYEMLGTRGIWEDGWLAAAVHTPISNKGHFDQDEWQLYHVDVDRSESKDLAKENPEKLQALIKVWSEEAERNMVLPLDDRSALTIINSPRPGGEAARERYVYYPGTSPVPESVAVNVRNRSYKILANVTIEKPDAAGVIFAHGSRFGGHTLFLKGKKLHYVYNFLGIQPEQHLVSGNLAPGKYTLGVEFTREKAGEHHESLGSVKLYVNDKVVAQGAMRTQAGKFTLGGDGLCVGYDSADAVSREYQAPGTFKGGTIQGVAVTVEKAEYADLEQEAQRVLMRQ
jgi:arylsulfatase